jgi:hypothetical protein
MTFDHIKSPLTHDELRLISEMAVPLPFDVAVPEANQQAFRDAATPEAVLGLLDEIAALKGHLIPLPVVTVPPGQMRLEHLG